MSTKDTKEIMDSVIAEVSEIVSEMSGIQLGPKQYSMIENRLKARMIRLQIDGFESYLSYLRAHLESESQALLSLITTHHTYFFREFSHFEFLLNRGLQRLIESARARTDKTIYIWSAACSRGQEVYSLAMFFHFHLKEIAPDVKFLIYGTDVDPESVKHAQNGVYKAEELKQSPAMYVNGHWIRGTGHVSEFSKVKDTLKSQCRFETCNLLNANSFLAQKKFDLIFCRNVFIYFNPEQIKSISQNFLNHLDPDGFLVLGVSESLHGLNLKTDLIGPSTYQHPRKAVAAGQPAPKPIPREAPPKIIEALCVDDSTTIHALLKKILVPDQGFQIKSIAKNGLEALELLKTNKYDIITLDLHMPELDGIGFLQKYQPQNIPVVVLSSINRDDVSIAQKAIALGAQDYIEKPSLENLAQAGNEIRAKIKTVLKNREHKKAASTASSTPAAPTTTAKTTLLKAVPTKGTATKTTSTVTTPKVVATTAPKVASPMTKKSSKIKVMIVDDSETIRKILSSILKKDPAFEVVAEADRPSLVEDLIKKHQPDLITMDIHMPEMDGVQLFKKLYPKYKIPTVMISSISREEGNYVLDALESGAVDYIQKPQMSDLSHVSQQIIERLKVAAQVQFKEKATRAKKAVTFTGKGYMNSLVVLGASTGGTEAIRVVMESMPREIPPILIVQHIPPVFSEAFAQRLNTLCPFDVKEAKDGDEVKPNQVLIAPGGKQMGIKTVNEKLFVTITDDAPVNRHKPSVDYLFKSTYDANLSNVVGVVLTGMGADGAAQLKKLRDSGARTMAQDEETSVVYGMPREAKARGGAEFILPITDIAAKIIQCCEELQKKKAA